MSADTVSESSIVTPIEEVIEPTVIGLDPAYVRSETALHVLFFLMAAVILVLSFMMRTDGVSSVFLPGASNPMPETCSAKRLFGIDCPGCGMTRAFISISSGEFAKAWNFNRASFAVYLFVVVQIPWHILQIYRLRTRRFPIITRWAYLAPMAMVAVLTIHWIWKLSSQFG